MVKHSIKLRCKQAKTKSTQWWREFRWKHTKQLLLHWWVKITCWMILVIYIKETEALQNNFIENIPILSKRKSSTGKVLYCKSRISPPPPLGFKVQLATPRRFFKMATLTLKWSIYFHFTLTFFFFCIVLWIKYILLFLFDKLLSRCVLRLVWYLCLYI